MKCESKSSPHHQDIQATNKLENSYIRMARWHDRSVHYTHTQWHDTLTDTWHQFSALPYTLTINHCHCHCTHSLTCDMWHQCTALMTYHHISQLNLLTSNNSAQRSMMWHKYIALYVASVQCSQLQCSKWHVTSVYSCPITRHQCTLLDGKWHQYNAHLCNDMALWGECNVP